MRGRLVQLAVLSVAVWLVASVLVGCQDLGTSDGATTSTDAPTTAPIQTTTTEDLVRVPSYTDFKATYTGDDWVTLLESWRTAVEDGFSQAGLVADLELVAPGDTEYQVPEAGSMVPRGTVVHIRVAVYD